ARTSAAAPPLAGRRAVRRAPRAPPSPAPRTRRRRTRSRHLTRDRGLAPLAFGTDRISVAQRLDAGQRAQLLEAGAQLGADAIAVADQPGIEVRPDGDRVGIAQDGKG